MDQHAIRCLPLAGMAGDGKAMIEMRMKPRIELQLAACVHHQTEPPVRIDTLHCAKLAVRRFQLARRRCELDTVSNRERPLAFAIDGHALLTAWIVNSL